MTLFRRAPFVLLVVLALACNYLTRALPQIVAPTGTAASSPTLLPVTGQLDGTPAYIPPDCEGKPIATIPPATEMAEPTPAIRANPEIDQKTQLHIFDEVVKVIADVYVYPDYNGLDWKAITAAHRKQVEAGISTEAFYNVMQSMVSELGDEHSRFDSPVDVAEAAAELSGKSEFVGIGVLAVPELKKARVGIGGVFPGSPADHSGLKVHDSILAVDGLPIVEGDQAYTYRVRGPECSTVRLTIQSPGGAPRDVYVMRHRIEGDLPVDARLVPTTDGARIGYIMLPSFFDEKIPGEVADALNKFGTLDGLIIDNRFNGGGSSDVVEPVLSYFVSGTLGAFKSRTSSRPLAIQAEPLQNSQTVPLVVLVGQDTASFGEIFSGALQDQGRARIVGQTSPGNVEVLHGYDFEDGSRLWIAEETFDPARSHANWEQTGIVPDVQAYADWDTFTFENDPAIIASVKLLGHK